jgi:chaperone modulatory protein CbpM
MNMNKSDFLERLKLDHETLEIWIDEQWLIPSQTETELSFSEVDVARANLIRDLKADLNVNDAGVGVILNLLDQMHGLRRALAGVLRAVHERSV